MKTFILIGCLIGSIFAYTSHSGQLTNAQSTVIDLSYVNTEVQPESTHEIELIPASPVTQTQFKLQTVNGITLYDDASSVTEKLGKPINITADPHLEQLTIYQYTNMTIIFSDDIIQSVEIAENSKTLLIDGVEVAAQVDAISEALGEPDYHTEDGIVFERGEALLKLFIDTDTQKLTSIHYFHSMSM